MNNRTIRRVYLVTYSRADLELFPDRADFGRAVAEAFDVGASKVKTYYYAVCRESHRDGTQHYHVAIKLTGPKRWLGAKQHIMDNHGVVVHFSDEHDSYFSAYRYVCKEDDDVFLSEGHPNLAEVGPPATQHCIQANRNKRKRKLAMQATAEAEPPKPKRLTPYDVSKFLVEHNVRDKTSLFAIAKRQERDGKLDLINFCINYTNLEGLIENTWELEDAPQRMVEKEGGGVPRMDTIRDFAVRACPSSDCDGLWLELAKQVLQQNNVPLEEFAAALRELLERGRGKHRNILITGPKDCAKTFILKPIKEVFPNQVFNNPGNDKYSLANCVHKKIIFLNDFRWNKEVISWRDFLLLLEGEPVHLPTPRNHFRHDVCLEADTPIFATSIAPIVFKESYNGRNIVEDEMMAARWKMFKFTKEIPKPEQRECEPCPYCFSRLVLS